MLNEGVRPAAWYPCESSSGDIVSISMQSQGSAIREVAKQLSVRVTMLAHRVYLRKMSVQTETQYRKARHANIDFLKKEGME